nr:TIGR04283 family arsenosugar biosynthesis glycosyltransferase [Pseudohongiella spirulinae]
MNLSIIIPVLNELTALQRCQMSLYRLRSPTVELIVVDGGSSDGTVQVARQITDQVLVCLPGRSRQMNAGAAMASGKVLLFLHIDTELPPGALELLESGLGACQWGRFDVRLSGRHPAFRVIETAMNLRSRVTSVATGDQAMFVNAALFRQLGGFPDLPLMEDVALSKILRRHGRPLNLAARVTSSSRRWEQRGILRTVLLMWRLRLAYFMGADPAVLHRQYYPDRYTD